METYKVIANIDELKWFYDNVISKPVIGESLMACLSCRNKKLEKEEREALKISKAEMFHTEISKPIHDEEYSWINFLSFISKFETNVMAYVSKSGLPYPAKSIVLYMYLNPCSEAKVVQDTLERINAINADMIGAAIKHSKDGVKDSIWKMGTILNHIKSCHARNPSRKVLLDFDIDISDLSDDDISKIHSVSEKFFKKQNFFMVRTSGGIHVLVKSEAAKFNPNLYIDGLKEALVNKEVKEIVKNDNAMCPVPGTYQYGNEVRILNKEDFK